MKIGKAYGWAQKDGIITLDPEQAKVRRLMCELTLQGKGSTEVAKIVNDMGHRNTVGNEWRVSDIPRLVYDHLNVGTVILNQKRYDFEAKRFIYPDPSEWVYLEDVIPAIVTKDEWERLQAIRKDRTTVDRSRGKKAGKSVFSGKLVCGCCGKPYWRKSNCNKEQEFWVCSTKQTKGRMTRALDAVGGKKGEHNEAVIYPDTVKIVIPSFSKDLLVKRFQFVRDRYGFTKGSFAEFKQFLKEKRPDLTIPE